jgi:hypothetical protein
MSLCELFFPVRRSFSQDRPPGPNLRLQVRASIAGPKAQLKAYAGLATYFAGAMVVMICRFVAQKEKLDGYDACCPISRPEAY